MRNRTLMKDQRGAAAVEFAILLPLMILLLAGMVEFGLAMYNKQILTNASREAARAGIVAQSTKVTPTEITDIALDYCKDFLVTFESSKPAPTVVTDLPDGTQNFGDRLVVTVNYNYQFLFLPDIQGIFGGTAPGILNLQAVTTMRYE